MGIVLTVAETLQRLGYVKIVSIKSSTIEVDTKENQKAKWAKLIVKLEKTAEFDSLELEYDKNR